MSQTSDNTPRPSLLDRLLAANQRTAGSVTIPELDLTVHLRRWKVADELRAVQVCNDKARPGPERTAELLRLCVCDAAGVPLFAEGDAAAFQVDADVAERIIDAALAANGVGGADQKKATSPPARS